MIKRVKKRAIPFKTWVGGTCWSERARFIKSMTMEIRKKLVVRMRILGARESTVKRRSNCTEKETSLLD
jgi:hypothetical protein